MLDTAGEAVREMMAQRGKWGEQNNPNGTGGDLDVWLANRYRDDCDKATANGTLTWRDIFLEEVFEATAELDPGALREELIQVSAVCLSWCQAIDRKQGNND